MPTNPNKDQQQALKYFHSEIIPEFYRKKHPNGLHEGFILQAILLNFSVTKQHIIKLINDMYVDTGILEKKDKLYFLVENDIDSDD